MKVSLREMEDFSRLSVWLGFLREARKITLQSLATAHATQRSNLSAFVTSGGKTRNVSPDKIRAVLFQLGLLPDGMLTPGLHRWTVAKEMIPAMCELLALNQFERGFIFELGSGYGVFVVVQVAASILVFANLPAETTLDVKGGLCGSSEKINVITLDRVGDSQMQTLWMTKDDVLVEDNLLSLMG